MFHEITLKNFPFYISFPSENSKIRDSWVEKKMRMFHHHYLISHSRRFWSAWCWKFLLWNETHTTQQQSFGCFLLSFITLSSKEKLFSWTFLKERQMLHNVIVYNFISTESCVPELFELSTSSRVDNDAIEKKLRECCMESNYGKTRSRPSRHKMNLLLHWASGVCVRKWSVRLSRITSTSTRCLLNYLCWWYYCTAQCYTQHSSSSAEWNNHCCFARTWMAHRWCSSSNCPQYCYYQ